MLPKEPAILLSYVNMKLRNNYASLREFCEEEHVNVIDLCSQLDKIDYEYSEKLNQFV